MSVTELMYGMMLPSGNDAAQSLGIYFGNFLLKKDQMGSAKSSLISGNIDEDDFLEDETDEQ
jgi:hypothetical protein